MSGLDVRMFTVGPVQENCFVVRRPEATEAVIVDPGEESDKLLCRARARSGSTSSPAILVTHTHFDHIGAVAPVAAATGAPVWCPELERQVLANIMDYVPWEGFGPFESYEAEHTVVGGETLSLAGIDFDVDVHARPQPRSRRRTAADGEDALFSGDVLFQGSVGRVDLPGGDWPTLLASIET